MFVPINSSPVTKSVINPDTLKSFCCAIKSGEENNRKIVTNNIRFNNLTISRIKIIITSYYLYKYIVRINILIAFFSVEIEVVEI